MLITLNAPQRAMVRVALQRQIKHLTKEVKKANNQQNADDLSPAFRAKQKERAERDAQIIRGYEQLLEMISE